MIPIEIAELRSLGLGVLEGEGAVTGLTIDSRLARPGDLFVAVRGGREFVAPARQQGAATLVPDDEHAALAAIGRVLRDRSGARVVGITGSTGKTSTKDILASLCAPVVRTVATEASYNAELGVPLTLGRLETDTELCLVEMGMRGFGQIAELCAIARPDVGIITAVGPVHLELVGSVEGVARSKAELVHALPESGIAVVPVAPELEPYLPAGIDVRRVEEVDVELRDDGAHVAFGGDRIRFPLTSRHQAQNALTALVAYEALGLPLDSVQEGADTVELSRWRGEELPLAGGGIVVNDAYNANPTSMRAALEHLALRGNGRRLVAILGGMAELGGHAERYHRELGELARELGIEVLAVGELARGYGADTWVPDAESATAAALELVRPGDAVLVKASRAVGLEGIAPALANEPA
ncbi:MAG TPA: UDP-N-acetylmuramoyl-tripeptide--D-alanyl-D-alanine ligase [Gaiellaceae bacterium]|nr:UDP-N-acetylmuramoyl-tripeptide--D-alanyl-D-alanine ligase [Gaiellaceae bacterium]